MERLEETLMQLVARLDNNKQNQISQYLDTANYCSNRMEKYQFLIGFLRAEGIISHGVLNEYVARNPNLHIFEISAPTGFGKTWAEGHLKDICPELVKSTNNEYDLFLDGYIKIEVKASRAVEYGCEGLLRDRALSSDSKKRFDMNFQQLKPACCDVFIWVGVWTDVIRYWVFSSNDIENKGYSPQHRGNTGEGQIHLKESNIAEFASFESSPRKLVDDVRKAYLRQTSKDKND